MLWETYLLAQREIRRNVLRSALTVLGIVIGVAAVITMVTLGSGATAQVTSDISKLGSNMLQVRVGQGFGRSGGVRSEAPPFKIADAIAIEQNVSGLQAVAPVSNNAGQAILGNINWATNITGSTDAYHDVRDWPLAVGRRFHEGEMRSGQAVCVLGSTVREKLFGAEDPVGATLRLGKISFRVIGVLVSKGQSSFGTDQDDFVLIPLRTFQRRIAGDINVGSIMVSARDGVATEKVQTDIEYLLRERRGITANQENDFHVRDMKEIIATLTGTTRVMTALLGAVAAVSLLVGGIGIMNIMLVSVTERTREIGTRLAIGALERQVLLQFLVEAVVLACFGGLLGIILGLGAAALGASLLGVPFILNPGIVLAAFFFSAAVGVLFGYFPARQAARLNPIEALRHE
ncbi:MAG: multidrug ABC transporter substrate-binding protein [Desulfatitalea sp. BRH_c12]|nr:MAG: multidrug ABC transporter substrate-binding protein [Desulfatitalea sp. BRH_c12]